ncbi:glycosyltransferase [Aquiflexum gelatinilyticum]|uniref:Glycosyltransferase n=1 Tax=Aquiflexum gelatinilyticum TaxID=2961943 RepID=A0A9X2P624_9BACT|nr:glycosyltransferase [Aquiflexum gelatinilyticum]MCR9016688.1 glycosyltransferase [Aquiflexum gelatinilyticum]
MSQTQIVIASVLKPLKDPRLYYRFAISMRETNKYLINIIGFSIKKETDEKNIRFHSIFSKNRNDFSRAVLGLRLIKILIQVKPKLVIITTFELLPAALLGKLFFRYNLVYDIRENYVLNLEQNKTLRGLNKSLSKLLVRFIECCSNPFIEHYFFAEKVYQKEFPRIKNYTVLQNKYFGQIQDVKPVKLNEKRKLRFLISGTLTEVYGIIEGIKWFQTILRHFPQASLTILGHITMIDYGEKLRRICLDQKSIHLQISENPLPYSDILKGYQETDIVLLPYHQIPSISPKIPSKLYESIALGKPCLFQKNTLWHSICSEYPAGIGIDFTDTNHAQEKLEGFLDTEFFVKKPGEEILWKSDETLFLPIIEQLAYRD